MTSTYFQTSIHNPKTTTTNIVKNAETYKIVDVKILSCDEMGFMRQGKTIKRFKVHKDYKDYKNDKSREENMVAWGKARWERKFGNPFYQNSMF